ncbi:MAG: hypothetical protein J6A11_01350 [Lachnospiraceae bacterium]|nr:hypothetical protein [Lachnospiraceae bacterium]
MQINQDRMEAINMSNILTMVMLVIMGIVGGLSSIVLVLSFPAVLIWKIYRKIRYGYSLYD